MLRTLLESQAGHARRTGGTLVSVGVHTAVIALVTVATARATSAPLRKAAPPKPVTFVRPQIRDTRPAIYSGHRWVCQCGASSYHVLIPPLKVPTELPPIDNMRSPIDEHSFDGRGTLADSGHPAGGLAGPTDGIFRVPEVDKAAIPRPGNPAPVYPPSLRAAQIEGSVVARFVVDTSGLAEPASITFLEATHAQFADAVRQSLLRSRYLPATIGDHRVRQLVEQHFAFTLTR